jgi:hypothetical protein
MLGSENILVQTTAVLGEIVDFCERIEYAEQINDAVKGKNNNKGPRAEVDQNGGENNKGASVHANKSSSQGRGKNKKNERNKHTSYADSDGRDGCALHSNATDHTTAECRVIMNQVGKMRAQWEANPRPQNGNKCQKINNNNNNKGGNQSKNNGDFHTLLEKVEKVKESLERAMKQQQNGNGKRKQRENEKNVSFAKSESEESQDDNFNPDSFHLELEQLSISDNDPNDLNGQDE